VRGQRVGARRPAERQVDPARVHRQQGPERLGDLERGVVGEHDAGRADPDPRRLRADVGGQQLGRAAGEAVHVVVLGHPVPSVAGRLDRLRDAHRADERVRRRLAVLDPDKVQHRERERSLILIHH
jgi:hypothetical protein